MIAQCMMIVDSGITSTLTDLIIHLSYPNMIERGFVKMEKCIESLNGTILKVFFTKKFVLETEKSLTREELLILRKELEKCEWDVPSVSSLYFISSITEDIVHVGENSSTTFYEVDAIRKTITRLFPKIITISRYCDGKSFVDFPMNELQ